MLTCRQRLARQGDWVTTGRTSGRKTKRRKTIKPPRRSATTATPQTSDKKKIALLTRKLREALAQQTATTEILRVRLSGRRGIGDADQGVGPSRLLKKSPLS